MTVPNNENSYTKSNIEKIVSSMHLYLSSKKTKKKNVNVTVKKNDDLKLIKSLGYSVEYRLYRSTKKASKFAFKSKKNGHSTLVDTKGKKGTRYYYKVKITVYDRYGSQVASTKLEQCAYTSCKWTK